MQNYKLKNNDMKKAFFLVVGALTLPFVAGAATLSISPSSQNVNVGDTFTVTVNLDTQNTNIDGVDLRYLNYNPALLQVQDANPSVSGVQIAPGSLMPSTLANSVNPTFGRVTFSQVALGGSKYKGSGVLATITFKALASGNANVSLNYTPNSTTDSNVAAAGADALNAVVNGSYTIGEGAGSGGGSTSGGGGGSATSGGSTTLGGGGGSSSGGGYSYGTVGGTGSGYSGCTPGLMIASLSRNLSFGAKGDDVTSLQKFLIEKGYLSADNATGYFGMLTQAAVQKFQAAQGIVSSGSPETNGYGAVGPTTRARINSLSSGSVASTCTGILPSGVAKVLTRRLALASTGDDVKTLQEFLISKGYLSAGNVTGYFGPMTMAAVKKFQAAEGIVSSGDPETTGYGAVGPGTRAKINAMLGSSAGGAGSGGSSTSVQAQIEALQKQVNDLLLKLQQSQ